MAIVLPNGKQQYFTAAGVPLASGKLYTYAAGTSLGTPKSTYADANKISANANPTILDSRGEATVFWDGSYDVVLKDSLDNTIYTVYGLTTNVDITQILYDGVSLDNILKSSQETVVSSITALKALDKTKYTYAFVEGYYAKGDGGGGHYWYDSTDTTSSDNGGSIIVATDSGRWKLQTFGQPWSACQFGCKPDYTTNASTTLQAAIDALGGEGGTVIIDGAFLISDGVTVKSNVTLKGNNGAPAQISSGTYGPTTHPSVLVMPGTDTITMQSGARLEGLLVLESNLAPGNTYALPLTAVNAAAAVAAFSGEAITVASTTTADIELINTMILGFDYVLNTASSGDYRVIADHLYFDCTEGFYIQYNSEDHFSDFRSCRAFPFTTMDQGWSTATLDTRTGTAFYEFAGRAEYSQCETRQKGIGFHCDGSFTAHIGCIVRNDENTANSNTGFKYANTGGFSAQNIGCTAFNCGGNAVYCEIPVAGGIYNALTIVGGYFDNTSTTASATGLIYIVDGYYSISGTVLGFNGASGYIDIGANADYGTIDNISVYGTVQPIFGDATAMLKMRLGQVSYRTASPTLQPLTWTPVLKAGATAQTLSSALGHFTIQNNWVTAHFDITVSGTSGTGNLTITGLPYTAANAATTTLGMGGVTYYSGMATLASAPLCAVAKNTAIIDLYDFAAAAATAIDHTNITNTTRMVGWVTYQIPN